MPGCHLSWFRRLSQTGQQGFHDMDYNMSGSALGNENIQARRDANDFFWLLLINCGGHIESCHH